MRLQKLLTFSLLCLLFAACKEESNDGDDEQAKALFEIYNLLNDTYDKFHENAAATNGNPWEAIMLTDAWLQQQEGVASTLVFDSTYILINTEAGMQTNFSFITLNQDGTSKYRGSGRSSGLQKMMEGDCSHVIENKKVLIYAAAFEPKQEILNYFENSDVGFDVTLLKYEQCTPELLATFKDYGLVILDTHGEPNGYMTGTSFSFPQGTKPADYISFRDEVISQIGSSNYNRLITQRLSIGYSSGYSPFNINWWTVHQSRAGKYAIWVKSKYISESPELSNTIIFGNMCYSGYQATETNLTDPICAAFISKNPISYYAYAFNNQRSYPVNNDFAHQMEDSLVRSLAIYKDSTGIAHLKEDNTEFSDPFARNRDGSWGLLYFKQFMSPQWCYEGCGHTITDSRDGEQYPTVCIGNQVWMAKNLNYAGAGVCYDNNQGYCNVYGRLYSIAELTNLDTSSANPSGIRGLCPEGWHVPSTAEWKELFDAVNRNAGKLCRPSDWPRPNQNTNETGLTLLPGGQYTTGNDTSEFADIWEYGNYWSSSSTSDRQFYLSVLLLISSGTDWVNYNDEAKAPADFVNYGTRYYSCRCVKD